MAGEMAYIQTAASMANSALQAFASWKEQLAMQKAFNDELKRQSGYRGEAVGVWQQGLGQQTREQAQKDMSEGAAARQASYQQIGSIPYGVNMPGPSARDTAEYDMDAQRRAALGAYSDWAQKAGIAAQRTGQQLGKITNFAGGTAGVFPYRMYDAAHGWDQMKADAALFIGTFGQGAGDLSQYYGGPQMGQRSFSQMYGGNPGYTGGGYGQDPGPFGGGAGYGAQPTQSALGALE